MLWVFLASGWFLDKWPITGFQWISFVLIRKLSEEQYQLVTVSGRQEGRLEELVDLVGNSPLTLLLPAESCLLRQVEYQKHEKNLLHKIIPFSLEDELVDRVDDLHFVIGKLPEDIQGPGNLAVVCILEKAMLAAALAPFQELGLRPNRCLPETLMLPWQPGQWTLVFPDENRCLLRSGFGEGIACSRENLGLTLTILARNQTWPVCVQVISSEASGIPDARFLLSMVPGLSQDNLEFTEQPYWQLLSRSDTDQFPVNVLSGSFTPSLPWDYWWQRWKVAAILVLAIGVFDLTTRVMEIQALDKLNAQTATETQAIFRQVIPDGVLVDAAVQLQRRLEALKGYDGSGFVALLEKAAPVIMDNPDLAVQNLEYSEKDREIHLTLITMDFNTAESVRARLQSLGLQAELTGSSNSQEGNRSRLIIGDKG
jgi:type II secretion system protein L